MRQLMLLEILSGRHIGSTVKKMASEMEVSEKTICGDLRLSRQIDLPPEEVVCEPGRKSRWLDPAKSQPGLCFAFDEAVSAANQRRPH
jgi:predicted DNA-binding transcriptional regulator YafY